MGAVVKRCRIHQGEYKKYSFGEKASLIYFVMDKLLVYRRTKTEKNYDYLPKLRGTHKRTNTCFQ